MADLSDVTAYFANAAAAAVYPNGTSAPSVAPVMPGYTQPMDVRVMEGWPNADQLDLDLAGKMLAPTPSMPPVPRPNGPCADVSVYPITGAAAPSVYQIEDHTYVTVPPVFGMSAAISGNGVVTITGQPSSASEYLSLVIDRTNIYSTGGANTAAILATLGGQVAAQYPAATFTASTITIPNAYQLEARIGNVGTLGKVICRQRHGIMVTTWAPTHAARSTIAAAIDVAIKSDIIITLPDTSEALVWFSYTSQTDEESTVTLYRRDLVYLVDYATLELFPGYVVTSVTNDIYGAQSQATPPPMTPAIT